MRKWCERCGQRLQTMKPGDICKMCGWKWDTDCSPLLVAAIIVSPFIFILGFSLLIFL